MGSARDINFQRGSVQFNGNLSMYYSMLQMFDQLTVDDSIVVIYNALLVKDLRKVKSQLRNLEKAGKVVEAVGLSNRCLVFLGEIDQLEFSHNQDQTLRNQFSQFLEDVIVFKEEVTNLTGSNCSYESIEAITKSASNKLVIDPIKNFENQMSVSKVSINNKESLLNSEEKQDKRNQFIQKIHQQGDCQVF